MQGDIRRLYAGGKDESYELIRRALDYRRPLYDPREERLLLTYIEHVRYHHKTTGPAGCHGPSHEIGRQLIRQILKEPENVYDIPAPTRIKLKINCACLCDIDEVDQVVLNRRVLQRCSGHRPARRKRQRVTVKQAQLLDRHPTPPQSRGCLSDRAGGSARYTGYAHRPAPPGATSLH